MPSSGSLLLTLSLLEEDQLSTGSGSKTENVIVIGTRRSGASSLVVIPNEPVTHEIAARGVSVLAPWTHAHPAEIVPAVAARRSCSLVLLDGGHTGGTS